MRTKTIVTELDHSDLVELFSTAFYNSRIFGGNYNKEDLRIKDKNDCFEDNLAYVLLDGKSIQVRDFYAEDEADYYGDLPHEWDADDEFMSYTVTLKDIEKGIAKALDEQKNFAWEFVKYDYGRFDAEDAENLMQYILFGELIYG